MFYLGSQGTMVFLFGFQISTPGWFCVICFKVHHCQDATICRPVRWIRTIVISADDIVICGWNGWFFCRWLKHATWWPKMHKPVTTVDKDRLISPAHRPAKPGGNDAKWEASVNTNWNLAIKSMPFHDAVGHRRMRIHIHKHKNINIYIYAQT